MQDQVERRGAGPDGDGILGFMHARERLLELSDPVAHRHPAALDYLGEGGFLVRSQDGL
jgi:hypothetical protein